MTWGCFTSGPIDQPVFGSPSMAADAAPLLAEKSARAATSSIFRWAPSPVFASTENSDSAKSPAFDRPTGFPGSIKASTRNAVTAFCLSFAATMKRDRSVPVVDAME